MNVIRQFYMGCFGRWMGLAALFFVGCGGVSQPAAVPDAQLSHDSTQVEEVAEPIVIVPKNAADIAQSLVDSKVCSTFCVDKLRTHPLGNGLARTRWLQLFKNSHTAPLDLVSTVFLASTGISQSDEAILVARYDPSEDTMHAILEEWVERSNPPGQWMTDTSSPTAQVTIQGQPVLVMMIDGLLIMVPSHRQELLVPFVSPLELSSCDGPEALVAEIDDPSETLRVQGAPAIPPTLSQAEVRVFANPDGTTKVHGQGLSTGPEQAALDAAALTRSVNRATSVKVSFVRVRFFPPIVFRADRDKVHGDMNLSAEQVTQFLALGEMLGNR